MKTLLFDFGGTLDTNGIHWCEKFRELYPRFNITLSREEFDAAYLYSEMKMGQQTQPGDDIRTMLNYQIMLQIEYLKNNCHIHPDEYLISEMIRVCLWSVFDQARKSATLMQYLKQWFRLGIVSNFNGNLIAVVRSLKLAEYFDVLIDSKVVGFAKPDTRIISYALEQLHATAEKAYFIGDSYDRDIQPAKALGCSTIWLDGKSWRKPDSTGDADYIIGSLEEIIPILMPETENEHNESKEQIL